MGVYAFVASISTTVAILLLLIIKPGQYQLSNSFYTLGFAVCLPWWVLSGGH